MERSDSFQDLLRKFKRLSTTDHGELVSQFKELVRNEVTSDLASSILSTADWNLEEALNYYFDYQSSSKVPQMMLLQDEMADGVFRNVLPNTDFTQTWKIYNSGESKWPVGCECICTQGHAFYHDDNWIEVKALIPGDSTFVTINMRSPEQQGIYTIVWRMQKPDGVLFGDVMAMEIRVAAV